MPSEKRRSLKIDLSRPYGYWIGKYVPLFLDGEESVPEPIGDENLAKRIHNAYPYTEHQGWQEIKNVRKDRFGNVDGTQYDLVRDGAFSGVNLAVLHLYTGEGFDFKLPEKALSEKGFFIHRWTVIPELLEFNRVLSQSSQLWLISTASALLSEGHLEAIKKFFYSGRGIYIWGDNDPYYADANALSSRLFGITMSGNLMGDKVVSVFSPSKRAGFVRHAITTGLEYLYEGVTVATLQECPILKPLVYGSAGNLVTALHDEDGKRAIIDGGFTRLFNKWDTAGTARYVKNAAAWLANYERWGSSLFPNKPS